ncbi:MAG: transcriptional regulator [Nitrospirae bacterium]|nr:transcriptional regulator [Nitrospirota bacterium]
MTDSVTKRQELLHLLRRGRYTARELAEQLDLPERDVEAHLPHVLRSIAHDPRLTFLLEPSTCRACGFRFRTRTRFTRPGRCPRCRSEDISSPRFGITEMEPRKA